MKQAFSFPLLLALTALAGTSGTVRSEEHPDEGSVQGESHLLTLLLDAQATNASLFPRGEVSGTVVENKNVEVAIPSVAEGRPVPLATGERTVSRDISEFRMIWDKGHRYYAGHSPSEGAIVKCCVPERGQAASWRVPSLKVFPARR